ncbi:probable receptor-like protein kinase At1g33260 isoform X2 [Andrographis paniculata]|uniref:probable receptor-like protein kinase At1g33260 isoform X2 n=1 Tax=Andrographis paniculata TaxID=175694 RepID=UPI0021E9113C|nr:probable receptor-like protein kinase At1g33260 isoform X2 [Andrographis paniculata]
MEVFVKIKVIKRRRVADRVAAVVDFEEDDDHHITVCNKTSKGLPIIFSWEEIQKLTMNFAIVIGHGGFSTVYLAQFPNSAAAAVKIQCCSSSERIDLAHKQELEILLHLNHPNIVKLIGHCHDTEKGILVIEYVPNGTLQDALHNQSSKKVLPWRKRTAIAFQIALAMEYLHDNCTLHIVHGDIKSSNVLLDDKLDCKLCDFGSAKLGFSAMVAPPSSTNRRTRAMIVGSPGYTDPHYLRTGLVSKKNDVYSFGVILLELITGKEALDPSTGRWLTATAQPLLQQRGDEINPAVVEMMDPRLRGEFELEDTKAMAALAAACLADSPALRPSASEILATMRNRIPYSCDSFVKIKNKKLNRSSW